MRVGVEKLMMVETKGQLLIRNKVYHPPIGMCVVYRASQLVSSNLKVDGSTFFF